MNIKNIKLVLPANYDIKLSDPYCAFVEITFKDIEQEINLGDDIYRYYFKGRLDNKIHSIDIHKHSKEIILIDEILYSEIVDSYENIPFSEFNLLDQLGYLIFLSKDKKYLDHRNMAIELAKEYTGSTMKSNRIYKEYTKYMPESIVKHFHLETMDYVREHYYGKGLELGIKNGDFLLKFKFIDSVDLDNSFLRGHIIADIEISQDMSMDEEWHNDFLRENSISTKLNIPYYLFKNLTKFLDK